MLSVENFVFASDDFSTYYNNYLGFVFHNDTFETITEFNYFEFGLPFINYLSYLIILEPEPYKLKAVYVLIQSLLLILATIKISSYYRLGIYESAVLLGLVILLYNPLASFQVSRQAIASFFIVMSIFSRSKYSVVFFFTLSLVFHLSSLVLYPVVRFLLLQQSKKDYIRVVLVSSAIAVFIVLTYKIIGSSLVHIPLVNKMDFILQSMIDSEKISLGIKTSIILVLYIIPLLLYIFIYYIKFGVLKRFSYNVLSIFSILIILCFVPGFNNRVLLISMYMFLGYYYFFVIFGNGLNLSKRLCVVILSLLVVSKGQFLTNSAYSRHGIVVDSEFHHFHGLNEKKGYINRDILE